MKYPLKGEQGNAELANSGKWQEAVSKRPLSSGRSVHPISAVKALQDYSLVGMHLLHWASTEFRV